MTFPGTLDTFPLGPVAGREAVPKDNPTSQLWTRCFQQLEEAACLPACPCPTPDKRAAFLPKNLPVMEKKPLFPTNFSRHPEFGSQNHGESDREQYGLRDRCPPSEGQPPPAWAQGHQERTGRGLAMARSPPSPAVRTQHRDPPDPGGGPRELQKSRVPTWDRPGAATPCWLGTPCPSIATVNAASSKFSKCGRSHEPGENSKAPPLEPRGPAPRLPPTSRHTPTAAAGKFVGPSGQAEQDSPRSPSGRAGGSSGSGRRVAAPGLDEDGASAEDGQAGGSRGVPSPKRRPRGAPGDQGQLLRVRDQHPVVHGDNGISSRPERHEFSGHGDREEPSVRNRVNEASVTGPQRMAFQERHTTVEAVQRPEFARDLAEVCQPGCAWRSGPPHPRGKHGTGRRPAQYLSQEEEAQNCGLQQPPNLATPTPAAGRQQLPHGPQLPSPEDLDPQQSPKLGRLGSLLPTQSLEHREPA
uniref:basic salivary proline-rich protein 2-like n=1 Tax=Odobenus rosmarus divergens TaxID=9708 RepID=UPI00063CD09E|nr:PREDICTED: basic salivary proline-rich protein 2-like [Odobenus rosmarus divergens]